MSEPTAWLKLREPKRVRSEGSLTNGDTGEAIVEPGDTGTAVAFRRFPNGDKELRVEWDHGPTRALPTHFLNPIR